MLISRLGDEYKEYDFSFKDGAMKIVKHSTRLEVIASDIMNQVNAADIRGYYTGRIPCIIGCDEIVQPAKSFLPRNRGKCLATIHCPTFVLEIVDNQTDFDLTEKLALWVSEKSTCNIAFGVNISTGKCFLHSRFLPPEDRDLNSEEATADSVEIPRHLFYDTPQTTEPPFILRLQPIRDIIKESICFE